MSSNPQTLYLFKNLNNYFNRKLVLSGIKTLEEIETNEKLVAIKDNINVSTGDGIRAKITISFKNEDMVQYNNDLINGSPTSFPDYAILKLETQTGELSLSRWFIIESNKLSYGNYVITLQRDVIADYYEEVRQSFFFLEKGYVDENDPLVFNDEGQSFNQIKKQEILIKDISKCGWIVGYIAKKSDQGEAYTISVSTQATTIVEDLEYGDLPQDIVDALDRGSATGRITGITLTLDIYNNDYYSRVKSYFNALGNFKNSEYLTTWMWLTCIPIAQARQQYGNVEQNSFFRCTHNASGNYHISDGIIKEFYPYGLNLQSLTLYNYCSDYAYNYSNYASDIMSYDGKIIKLPSNAFVRIHITRKDDTVIRPTISNNNNLQTLLKNVNPIYPANPLESNYWWEYNRDPQTGDIEVSVAYYEITQEPLRGEQISITIPTTRNACVDAPYDMFAIPYGGLNESGSKEDSLKLAYGMSEALGDRLYDLQLLPYCPAQNFVISTIGPDGIATWNDDIMTENYDYVSVEDQGQVERTRIIFPQTSKQNFSIIRWQYKSGYFISPYLDYSDMIRQYDGSVGLKILDQTYLFRFVSPNYASVFEFSIAKNNCVVDYIQVNLNYKPYNPFIRVAPNFEGLYGAEYNDQRGLICGGDYSLAMISNAWTQYEINNKNYQLIFDRQVQHLGVSQQIETEKQRLGMFNIIPTAMASALGGSLLGGGIGGALAGGIGLGTAIVNQSMQANWLDQSQKEAKSYMIDNFNYTLGNIKALPNTLTKVGALNEVNKIFPFIEIYESTPQEREMFVDKLHYNGMTINKIVGLGAYIDSLPNTEVFIKGQLIRMDSSDNDSHVIYQIYEELLKGIYIDKGDYTG